MFSRHQVILASVLFVEASGLTPSTRQPQLASKALPRIDPSYRVIIGSIDGPREKQFERVVGAVRLTNGEIVVADGGSQQLRWFSRDGVWIRSVGRRGKGPREFEGLRTLVLLSGDSLLVEDALLDRISTFDRDGRFLTSWSTTERLGTLLPAPVGRLGNGDFVALRERALQRRTGRDRFTADLLRARAGNSPTVMHSLPSRESFLLVCGPDNTAICNIGVPYSPRAVAAVSHDRIFFGNGERYEILTFHAGRIDTISRSLPRRPVTSRQLQYYRDSVLRRTPVSRRPVIGERLAQAPSAAFMPYFTALRTDDVGRLWVGRTHELGARDRPWDVFDVGGSFLGTIPLPVRLHVTYIGRGFIVGVMTDEDGVEVIEIRRYISA